MHVIEFFCFVFQECTLSDDCGDRSVCLGVYLHPSGISYPIDPRDNNTCGTYDSKFQIVLLLVFAAVGDTSVGESVLSRFKVSTLLETINQSTKIFSRIRFDNDIVTDVLIFCCWQF